MHLLIASLLPLLLVPLFAGALQRYPTAIRAVDAFVLVTVGGLVLLDIAPVAVVSAGVWGVVALVVGLIIPGLGERVFEARPSAGRTVVWSLAVAAIALHATMDGLAVSPDVSHSHSHGVVHVHGDAHTAHADDHAHNHHHGHAHDLHEALHGGVEAEGASDGHPSDHAHDGSHGLSLALAVVVHRIPVALALWWLVRPRFGLRMALLITSVIASCSIVGFSTAHWLSGWMQGPGLAAFQALVAGTLLHVVVGHGSHAHGPDSACTDDACSGQGASLPAAASRWNVASGIGALCGIGALVAMLASHPIEARGGAHLDMIQALGALVSLTALPAAGALAAIGLVRWLYVRRGPHERALRGVAVRGSGFGWLDAFTTLPWAHLAVGAAVAVSLFGPVATAWLTLACMAAWWFAGEVVTLAEVRVGRARRRARSATALAAPTAPAVSAVSAAVPGTGDAEDAASADAPASGDGDRRVLRRPARALDTGRAIADDIAGPFRWLVLGLLGASVAEPLLDMSAFGALDAPARGVLLVLCGSALGWQPVASVLLASVLVHKGVGFGYACAAVAAGIGWRGAMTAWRAVRAEDEQAGEAARRARGLSLAAGLTAGVVIAVAVAVVSGFWVDPSTTVGLHSAAARPFSAATLVAVVALGALFVITLVREGAHGAVVRMVNDMVWTRPALRDGSIVHAVGDAPSARPMRLSQPTRQTRWTRQTRQTRQSWQRPLAAGSTGSICAHGPHGGNDVTGS